MITICKATITSYIQGLLQFYKPLTRSSLNFPSRVSIQHVNGHEHNLCCSVMICMVWLLEPCYICIDFDNRLIVLVLANFFHLKMMSLSCYNKANVNLIMNMLNGRSTVYVFYFWKHHISIVFQLNYLVLLAIKLSWSIIKVNWVIWLHFSKCDRV